MAGATPIYGFPYASVTDSPNGPAQQQALAEAVEAKMQDVDGDIAVVNGLIVASNTEIGQRRKLLGARRLGSNTAAFAAETAVLEVPNVEIPANTFYVIELVVNYNVSSAGAKWIFRFKNSTTNLLLKEVVDSGGGLVAGVPLQSRFNWDTATVGAETRSIYFTAERYSGGGNIVIEAGSYFAIYAEGPVGLLS